MMVIKLIKFKPYINVPFKHKSLESVITLPEPVIDALQVYTPASVDEACVNVSTLSNFDNELLIVILSVLISLFLNKFTTSEEILGPIGLVRQIVHTTDTSVPITPDDINFTVTDETLVSVMNVLTHHIK